MKRTHNETQTIIREAQALLAKMDEHIAEARRSIVSSVEVEGQKTRTASIG